LEREGVVFHAAVRRAYRELAPARGWVVVDANPGVDDVAARVRATVEPLLAG
jgi:thymidylate kinase